MRKNTIIILMTIFSILLISVAWSAFSTNLYISGEASILPDTTPPTCGEWKLRPSSLTYQEATTQNAFINPATNNTWTQDSLILSVDCSDDTSCIADHYDVKTYNTTIRNEAAILSQVIEDVTEHSTTCTLPVGGSNPYVDKDAPTVESLAITPLDGEFKISLSMLDVSTYPTFENIDGAYYTYEGKSFIGTGVENVIISENIIGKAQYATADGTDNGEGANPRYTFADSPAADAAEAYCTGCRLMTKEEAIAWDSTAGTGISIKRIGRYNYFSAIWWLAGDYSTDNAWVIYIDGNISYANVTHNNGVRPAVTISSNMTMSGSGTQGDPYVILPADTRPTVYTGYEQSGLVSTQFYYKKCSDNNWTALTKDTFNATDSKSYTDWYIPSNGTSSTSCLASSWGTYHFKVDVEDAVGNTKTYYNTGTSGVTDNVNNMTQFALLPPSAEHITYSNNSTNCTNLECAINELKFLLGTQQPGLYDANYSMVKTWDELEALGLTKNAIETDYTSSTYNQSGSPYKILTDNNLSGKLVLPSTITKIGAYVFYNYSGITSITIPSSVTSIGDSAFYGCSGLTGKLVIPNSVTSIGTQAFRGCRGITGELVIPNSVTSIGNSAFYGCSGLTGKLVIPSSITSIGTSAFRDCSGLTSITIPNSVTSIGTSAFHGCSGLTSVTIPSSVTSIGTYAFNSCSGLTGALVIPSSVTSIGTYAFYGCSGLTSVTIPSSVTNIGTNPFSGCSGLTSITVDSNNTVYDSRNNSKAIIKTSDNRLVAGCKNTTIPDSVRIIEDSAFYNNKGLTSITIPSSVESIYSSAFQGCSNLTSVTIPSSVTDIGQQAFDGCSSLTSITIPSGVININRYTFRGCSSLTSITIPSNVKYIGDHAFDGCSNLTSATFANRTGWFVTTESSATSGTNLTLTDTTQNATYLRSTYYNYYWKRN